MYTQDFSGVCFQMHKLLISEIQNPLSPAVSIIVSAMIHSKYLQDRKRKLGVTWKKEDILL